MRAAFTLVEMLVVITIIGILAALGTGAVMNAVHRAKIAAVGLEISQLDQACKDYKARFGEYPPDFTDLGAVARHLAKAFPRYPGSYNGNWPSDLCGATGLTVAQLTPQTALAIWLGGIPDPNNGGHLSGFAADPTNPFQPPAACPSRIPPFFEFDVTRLSKTATSAITYGYWPKNAVGNMTTGAITYFRAENGNYLCRAGARRSPRPMPAAPVLYIRR